VRGPISNFFRLAIDMDGDRSATGIKNVSVNEPYFQGHFPRNPTMPGMLLIEGLAQTAGALCMSHLEVREPPLVYFMGIDKARFRRPVMAGDTVHYCVKKNSQPRTRVALPGGKRSSPGLSSPRLKLAP
jgi:3-hydroxymyristoyl/3-hydroxydecanoyl-(acyl carrier protein) dehydratase